MDDSVSSDNGMQGVGIHNTVTLSSFLKVNVVLETRYWTFYKNPYQFEYLLSKERNISCCQTCRLQQPRSC